MKKSQMIELLEILQDHKFKIDMMTSRFQNYNITIQDFLKDDEMLCGEKGGFLVFFNR